MSETLLYFNSKSNKMHKIVINDLGIGVVTLPLHAQQKNIFPFSENSGFWHELGIDEVGE